VLGTNSFTDAYLPAGGQHDIEMIVRISLIITK